MVLLHLLKPFVILWASLNILDDVTVVIRIARLVGASAFHNDRASPERLCDMCDDVMEDLLKGSEGLEAVPCSWICLGTSRCTTMCETIQDLLEKSADFPCVAAGYCSEEEEDDVDETNKVSEDDDETVVCQKARLFSCEPKKFCRKRWSRFGFGYTCVIKPGMGRWMDMKKRARQYAAAVADGLLNQKRCGELGAGPYCIAKPHGSGRIAEFAGWCLSIVYGGYASTVAIETPGGDDDQQWLTFWVIFVASMLLEQTFARVLLSKFPFYYQVKLVFIVWLTFFDGAAFLYRRWRRRLMQWSPYYARIHCHRSQSTARSSLDSMVRIGGDLIADRIALLEHNVRRNPRKRNSLCSPRTELFWEYDYTAMGHGGARQTSSLDAEERLYQVSKWILSSEGMQQMDAALDSTAVALLVERVAAVLVFQPKFLNIRLRKGRLQHATGSNGQPVDCYVKFALRSDRPGTVSCTGRLKRINRLKNFKHTAISRVARRTIQPEWNQSLEISTRGGVLGNDGTYQNHEIKDTVLVVEAWHASCGTWGLALDVFQATACGWVCVLVLAYVRGSLDVLFHETPRSINIWWWNTTILVFTVWVAVGLSVSWVMSVMWKADDDLIGNSVVPLEILTDRRRHALVLHLQTPSAECGRLHVELSLSEN